jgi:putative DNA primase/helicase
VDEAIRRRLNLLPFTVTIPREQRDLNLTEKLKAEWPGILSWMIEGCMEWQRVGLTPPAAVRAATDAYFEEEDTFTQWLGEKTERDGNAYAFSGALFASWKVFAEAAGESAGSHKSFTSRMTAAGFETGRTRAGRKFDGIRLKEAASFTGDAW